MRYPSNLCDLTPAQQHAIEVDKKRWFLAHNIRKNKTLSQGETWLRNIEDDEQRADMTRRLNTLAENDFQQMKKDFK